MLHKESRSHVYTHCAILYFYKQDYVWQFYSWLCIITTAYSLHHVIVFHPGNVGMNVRVQELLLQEGGGGGALETTMSARITLRKAH